MLAKALYVLLSLATPDNEQNSKTPEQWVAELTAIYANLDGYTASYVSVGEGKKLEATLAMDEASGLAVLHSVATKEGLKMEIRQWNTNDDRIYFNVAGKLARISGVTAEMKLLTDFFNNAPQDRKAPDFDFSPGLLLTSDQVQQKWGIESENKPFWHDPVENASIKEVGLKTITFDTKEHGHLTISRETGMLVRQYLKGEQGEERVLELKHLQINPGKDAVVKLSAGWDIKGAREQSPALLTMVFRQKIFQSLIDEVEKAMTVEELGKLIDDRRDSLRRFADHSLPDGPDSLLKTDAWKKMLDFTSDGFRKLWLETHEGAKADDDEAFKLVLAKRKMRLSARDGIVKNIIAAKEGRERIAVDMLGPAGSGELKATKEAGETAKKLLIVALARAYYEAVIERKMVEYWGPEEAVKP